MYIHFVEVYYDHVYTWLSYYGCTPYLPLPPIGSSHEIAAWSRRLVTRENSYCLAALAFGIFSFVAYFFPTPIFLSRYGRMIHTLCPHPIYVNL